MPKKGPPENFDDKIVPPTQRLLFPFSRYTFWAKPAVVEKINCFDLIQLNNVKASCKPKSKKDDYGQYSIFLNVGSVLNFDSTNLYDMMGTDAYENLFGLSWFTECDKEFDLDNFQSRYDRETLIILSVDHFDQDDPAYDTNALKRMGVCTRYDRKEQTPDFEPYTFKDKYTPDKTNMRAVLEYVVIQWNKDGTKQQVGCDTVLYGESLIPFGITNPQTWKLLAGAFFEYCDYKIIADVDVQSTQGYALRGNEEINFGLSLRTLAFFPDVPRLYRRIGIRVSVEYVVPEYNIKEKGITSKHSMLSPFIICLSEQIEGVVIKTADYEFFVIPSTINHINTTQIQKISQLNEIQGDELVKWLKVEKIPSHQKSLDADDKVYEIHAAVARKDVDLITFAVKKPTVKPMKTGDQKTGQKEKNPLLFFRSESESKFETSSPPLLLLANKSEDKPTDPPHRPDSDDPKIQKNSPLELLSEEEEEDFKQPSQPQSDDSSDEEITLKKRKKNQKHRNSEEKTSKKHRKK